MIFRKLNSPLARKVRVTQQCGLVQPSRLIHSAEVQAAVSVKRDRFLLAQFWLSPWTSDTKPSDKPRRIAKLTPGSLIRCQVSGRLPACRPNAAACASVSVSSPARDFQSTRGFKDGARRPLRVGRGFQEPRISALLDSNAPYSPANRAKNVK
jgi:hypothetical protein